MYLSCHDIPSKRLTNDNWSHDDAELSVWQMLTNYCNNKKIIPETEEIPDLHSEYSKLERILHELVENMHMATQEQCKDKIISNDERSGQGYGGVKAIAHLDENATYDNGKNNSEYALDQQCNLVNYNQSYLLYLWHMLDKHDLLASSVQRCSQEINAGDFVSGIQELQKQS